MAQLGLANRKYKKYLTSLQIAQFFTIMIHSIYHWYINVMAGPRKTLEDFILGKEVYFPPTLVWVEFFLMILMIVMFRDFFINSYNEGQKRKGASSGGTAGTTTATGSTTPAPGTTTPAPGTTTTATGLAPSAASGAAAQPVPVASEPVPENGVKSGSQNGVKLTQAGVNKAASSSRNAAGSQ